MLIYIMKLQDIAFAKDLALAQLMVDPTNVEKFSKYRYLMFPWLKTAETREKDAHIKVLEKAVKGGPLVIKPKEKRAKSRLIKRVEANAAADIEKRQAEISKKLRKMF